MTARDLGRDRINALKRYLWTSGELRSEYYKKPEEIPDLIVFTRFAAVDFRNINFNF